MLSPKIFLIYFLELAAVVFSSSFFPPLSGNNSFFFRLFSTSRKCRGDIRIGVYLWNESWGDSLLRREREC
jgi:hypothetical protein